MLKYNFCIVRQRDSILLLNRESPSWMGCWNGVGGKLEPGEGARESMERELWEETGLTADSLEWKGIITWSTPEGEDFGGMYVYLAHISDHVNYPTPVKMDEGILDWKPIGWIMHPDNRGVAVNIQKFLIRILEEGKKHHHHCVYEGEHLSEFESIEVKGEALELETPSQAMAAYMTEFRRSRYGLT